MLWAKNVPNLITEQEMQQFPDFYKKSGSYMDLTLHLKIHSDQKQGDHNLE